MASAPFPLLYADTDRSSDALYFGGVGVPDPFIAFGAHGRRFAVVSALEFARVRRESVFDVVLPLEAWLEKAKAAWPRRRVGAAEVIRLLAREYRVRTFTVPDDFAAGLFQRLRALGVRLTVADGPLFPEREIKGAKEAAAIKEGNRCSALGIAAAAKVLQSSQIRGNDLLYRGKRLTSERLKIAIEIACLEAGALSANTIAAGGDQACDPHDRGSGPLRANSLIVVDVFPRVTATGYFGDMTRTFLRGRASEAQRALVAAVRLAQQKAIRAIRTGVTGKSVHAEVLKVFAARNFETKQTRRGSVGFFHGTGHGLGLAIHEPPRVNAIADIVLQRGAVVTVEPGLYYPGLGGCRIEDVVQVTNEGAAMLSRAPYHWELR